MGPEEDDASASASKPKPKIHVPPRASMELFLTNGSFSPGPMTLVSSLFPDQTHFSFSQLLVRAMASPLADGKSPPLPGGVSQDDSNNNKESGLQRNRPPNLVVDPPRQLPENLSPFLLGMNTPGLLNSPVLLSPLQSPFGMSHQQALAHVTAQAGLSQSLKQMQSAEVQQQEPPSSVDKFAASETGIRNMPLETFPQEQGVVSSSDHKAASIVVDKPANDGYNWRKYGQKQVKASECPRSYYKCTHPDCPVRKKVERSVNGQICEVTYKGQHNHEQPQPSKRVREHGSVDNGTGISQVKPILPSQDHSEPNRFQGIVNFPSDDISHPETAQESLEHPTVPQDVDKEDDIPSAKRRSTDIGQSQQAVMESKIVLKTRSEVDLLDDGYRWRKYGQKVVKGNPYPRSYYRCTYAGCNVRKHVERASNDPKSIITTYEGKHNHDLPLGKSSSNPNPTVNASSQQFKTVLGSGASQSVHGSQDQKPASLHLKGDEVVA